MNYLLDTNVASEIRKPNCNIKVRRFIDTHDQTTLFMSAVSIGEISYGVERLLPGEKKIRFTHFLDVQIPEWFGDRVIPVDGEVMREWGRICARAGRTLPLLDSLIAATALAQGLTVLTRNTRDFEAIEGILLLNPWEEE
ncbi:MAG: type II toxin-antitoxin system VapC family toxin [Treponema sp.]|nr:type II toxin-antitoxin system VapC family toxin [Treponema sp.]